MAGFILDWSSTISVQEMALCLRLSALRESRLRGADPKQIHGAGRQSLERREAVIDARLRHRALKIGDQDPGLCLGVRRKDEPLCMGVANRRFVVLLIPLKDRGDFVTNGLVLRADFR